MASLYLDKCHSVVGMFSTSRHILFLIIYVGLLVTSRTWLNMYYTRIHGGQIFSSLHTYVLYMILYNAHYVYTKKTQQLYGNETWIKTIRWRVWRIVDNDIIYHGMQFFFDGIHFMAHIYRFDVASLSFSFWAYTNDMVTDFNAGIHTWWSGKCVDNCMAVIATSMLAHKSRHGKVI